MREYEPVDDGLEPTDFDEYFDIPARTAKDVAARVYIRVERDPKRAAILRERQGKAIIEVLQWIHDNRARLVAEGRIPPDDDQE